ncbi:3-hydroxyacyl-CoA dehydrogenase NAD-binding domain-containing protein [Psychrobacter celer]|uniref:3-hydroxyacyl-CoA dehydrogenase NAD-binding domain-containing protein n=1 Tax=Psychrobacter celer TaxID=306572 RepID=UPI003FD54E57
MMGTGIAYVTAKAGIEVVLLDTDHWIGSGQYAPQAVYRAAFFSPVDKMPLVEIIMGEQTDDATLRERTAAVGYGRRR